MRYAEGLWCMHSRRHGPVVAHCTDSEDFLRADNFCNPECQILSLIIISLTPLLYPPLLLPYSLSLCHGTTLPWACLPNTLKGREFGVIGASSAGLGWSPSHRCDTSPVLFGWLRSTVGGTPVFGQRTDPVLRLACSRWVTTVCSG